MNRARRDRKRANERAAGRTAGRHTQADHKPGTVPDGKRTPGPTVCPVCRPAPGRWDRGLAGKAVAS